MIAGLLFSDWVDIAIGVIFVLLCVFVAWMEWGDWKRRKKR